MLQVSARWHVRLAAEAAHDRSDCGRETASTVRRRSLPSFPDHSMDWPGERPISAAPTGVRTEILPALMSAFSGSTNCTLRRRPSSTLHLGFAWIPVGLGLLGVAVFWPTAIPASAGLHALTVGAIGSMTLAVMTRATLGHSARQLTADSWTLAIYILIAVAAISRVAAPIALGLYVPLLLTSGLLWSGAFILFTVHYGRMLLFGQ